MIFKLIFLVTIFPKNVGERGEVEKYLGGGCFRTFKKRGENIFPDINQLN
jgi:hypothetical protein